ncbi:hypothetical protein J3E69DRAFT_15812 [Trichoderma sp. SZMC 28015]
MRDRVFPSVSSNCGTHHYINRPHTYGQVVISKSCSSIASFPVQIALTTDSIHICVEIAVPEDSNRPASLSLGPHSFPARPSPALHHFLISRRCSFGLILTLNLRDEVPLSASIEPIATGRRHPVFILLAVCPKSVSLSYIRNGLWGMLQADDDTAVRIALSQPTSPPHLLSCLVSSWALNITGSFKLRFLSEKCIYIIMSMSTV